MGQVSPFATGLIHYVESRIVSGEYPIGSKLPSVRRLATKFHLSFGTAYRAIHTLQERGLIEQRGTAGLFVKSHRSIVGGNAGVFTVLIGPALLQITGLFHAAYLGVEKAVMRHNYQLQVQYVAIDKLTPEKLRQTAAESDGLLLLCEYDQYLRDFPVLPCPVVALLSDNSWNGLISTVNIDADDAACTATKYFREARSWLREVKVFSSPKPVYVARALAFASRWRHLGGRCEVRIGYPDENQIYRGDCGYFFTSDQWLQNASMDFHRIHQVEPAQKYAMLGVDGKQFLDPDFFRFPTIAVDWPQLGEIMVEELIRRRNEPELGARNISICGKLRLPNTHESLPSESV